MIIPPDYPWRPGMLSLQYGGPARLVGQDAAGRWNAWDASGTWLRYASLDGIEPDLTDGATKGALLEAVREAYKEPTLAPFSVVGGFIVTRLVDDGDGHWSHDTLSLAGSWIEDDADDERMPIRLPTEGAALLAAWEARPR